MSTTQKCKIENKKSNKNEPMTMKFSTPNQVSPTDYINNLDKIMKMYAGWKMSDLCKEIIYGLKKRDVYPRLFNSHHYEGKKHYISKLGYMYAKITGNFNTMERWGYRFTMHPEEFAFLACNDMDAYEKVLTRLVDDMAGILNVKCSIKQNHTKQFNFQRWEGYNLPVDFICPFTNNYTAIQMGLSCIAGTLECCPQDTKTLLEIAQSSDAKFNVGDVLNEYFNYLSIKKSTIPGAGKGVFTSKAIKKGEVVGWYNGKVYQQHIARMRQYIAGNNGDYDMAPDPRFTLAVDDTDQTVLRGVPVKDKNYGGCMQMCNDAGCPADLGLEPMWDYDNHKDKNNVYPADDKEFIDWFRVAHPEMTDIKFVLRVMFGCLGYKFFVATKDIPAGAELFYGYSHGYWNARHLYKRHPEVQKAEARCKFVEAGFVAPHLKKLYPKLWQCTYKMLGISSMKVDPKDTATMVNAYLTYPGFFIGFKKGNDKGKLLTWKWTVNNHKEFTAWLKKGNMKKILKNTTFTTQNRYKIIKHNTMFVKAYEKSRVRSWLADRTCMNNSLICFAPSLLYKQNLKNKKKSKQ